MALIGIAPLTMVRTRAGRSEYVYAGGAAPEDILDEDRERLVEEGFLREVDDVDLPNVVVVPDDPATGAAGEGVTLERPKNLAVKSEWAKYRIRQGLLTEDLVEGVTAAQLKDDAYMTSFLQQRAAAQVEAGAQAQADAEARARAEAEAAAAAAAAEAGGDSAAQQD